MVCGGPLSTREGLNVASGRMVSDDVPVKDIVEARQHMRLIQQFKKAQRQRYVKEAEAIRRQRRQRSSAAAYWETALGNFANANRSKLCLLVLGCGTPPHLRPPTWVMALGNTLNITRVNFEVAQRKAQDFIKEERESEGAQAALNGFAAASVRLRTVGPDFSYCTSLAAGVSIPLGEWRLRLTEELDAELPRPLRTAQDTVSIFHATFPIVRATTAVNQENKLHRDDKNSQGNSTGGTKPPLPISECRAMAFLGVINTEGVEIAADRAAGGTTTVACDSGGTGEEEEKGDPRAAVSRSPSFSNGGPCLRKRTHIGAEPAVGFSCSLVTPNMMASIQTGDDNEKDLSLSSMLNENVLRRVELLLRTHMELRSEFGYVKGMSCLAMMLAVVVTDPWELCVCFSSLLEYGHLASFLSLQQKSVIVHLNIFDAVLQKSQPALHALFQKYGVPLNSCLLDWWNTVFLGTLPYTAALRSWDLFLLDKHYLYRITLALLVYRFGLYSKTARKSLPHSYHSQEELLQVLNPSLSETHMSQQLFFCIIASDALCGIHMRSIRSIVKRMTNACFSH
ncbi:RabGAP/TBC domain-containing protein [Trypanosoma rangeli]|uniref:RabGAP/TBC domain-containing protein n=1 Tax=Trypanosoma rangeli TaxID=5698 RepID=A0A3R7RSP5_TRYRA|nr:RabGAP/TBC domain-containing protein [Trypanosoma rangeli]RNF12101.1 RabGAP/TBC domain-containing protein [Trypanosoma rangeli]|eukprot:RNF12101.1 RabGAP/TBC domain-containing protein [Trypanosoma rangeli]